MKKIIFTLIILSICGKINAQTETLKDNGSWFTFLNKLKVSEKIYIGNIVQQRNVNFLKNTQAIILASSINYRLSKYLSIGLGYLHYTSFPYGALHPSIKKKENRFFQNITLNSNVGKVKISNWLQFEERNIDLINSNVTPNVIEGDKYVNRIRYRIQASTNLLKLKNETFIMGKLSNEIRIRFAGGGISTPDFDQNNFAALLGYKLLPNSSVWIGYGRYYYRKNSELYISNNILHVNLSYDIDLTKKK